MLTCMPPVRDRLLWNGRLLSAVLVLGFYGQRLVGSQGILWTTPLSNGNPNVNYDICCLELLTNYRLGGDTKHLLIQSSGSPKTCFPKKTTHRYRRVWGDLTKHHGGRMPSLPRSRRI